MTAFAVTRSESVQSPAASAALMHDAMDLHAERAALCQLLSERLLSDYPAAACREVILGQHFDSVRFTEQSVTLLCCDPTQPEWTQQDLEILMRRLGGHVEQFCGTPMFRFTSPQAALRTALLLQGTCRRPIRAALHACVVTVAELDVRGGPLSVTLGAGADTALALMLQSAPGSIRVCPDSYRALASSLDRHSRGAIVTAEFEGDEVTCAFVTPTPASGAAFSTFAGLGAA